MSTNYTEDSNRRPSSRGGNRRPRRRNSNDSRSGGGSSSGGSTRVSRPPRKETPKKLSLWEKVVAFLTGKPAEQPRRRAPVIKQSTGRPARESDSAREDAPKRERKPRAPREPREPKTGMRKPESIEVTTPRVYVGNLSFDATESDLVELFAGVGIVQNAEIVCNRQTQRSKGFGFVQLQTIEEAQRAVSELHDKEYMGRKLVVSGAKVTDRRDDRDTTPTPNSDEVTPEADQTVNDDSSHEEPAAEISSQPESTDSDDETARPQN